MTSAHRSPPAHIGSAAPKAGGGRSIFTGADAMDDLEHMERKLGLPVAPDLPFNERLERIRTAMVTVIERADPVSAMRLQNDSEVAVIQFIRTVVEHDNRKGN